MSLDRRHVGLEIAKEEMARRHEEAGRAFPYTRELAVYLMKQAMDTLCDSLTNADLLAMTKETTKVSIDMYPIKEPK